MSNSKYSFTRRLVGLPWPPLLAVLLVLLVAVTFFVQRSVGTRGPARLEALSILVSGDTQGLLFPCGCASGQPGGLSRRGYLVKERAAGGRVLYADLGNAPSGDSPYDLLKFAAILRGELAMGVVAHNLGPAEVRLGSEELRRLAGELQAPFVSTNVRDAADRPLAESLRVVESGGRRIAVAGLLSPQFAGDDVNVKVLDPAEALAEALAEQPQYDSLLVLAYLPEDELAALAARLPEKTILIGPSRASASNQDKSHTAAPADQSAGHPGQDPAANPHGAIAGAVGPRGRSMVLVEFTQQAQHWTAGEVFVAPSLPDDEAQAKNIVAYHQELEKHDFPPEETSIAMPLPPDVASTGRVAGSLACRACHAPQCNQWEGSRHAFAWSSLLNRGVHYDAACQRCHTTGYGWEGGFRTVGDSFGAYSVGCESCHGPSLAHAIEPSVRTPLVASQQCTVCHDADNSPGFNYAAAWRRIQHKPSEHGAPGVPMGRVDRSDSKLSLGEVD